MGDAGGEELSELKESSLLCMATLLIGLKGGESILPSVLLSPSRSRKDIPSSKSFAILCKSFAIYCKSMSL